MITCADKPRRMEGAEADVPKNTISNIDLHFTKKFFNFFLCYNHRDGTHTKVQQNHFRQQRARRQSHRRKKAAPSVGPCQEHARPKCPGPKKQAACQG
jgi:hypothetical protein